MTVRPTPSGQIPGLGISRAQRPGVGGTPQRASDPPSAAPQEIRRDDVHISEHARELQQAGATQGSPELSPSRMREVLQRVSDGHYDQPDVQREVLRRLARDL